MIVSNTTPLINFAAIGRLDVLEHLFTQITIPVAVKQELFEKGYQYPSTQQLERVTFIKTAEIQNIALNESLKAELNAGEAEAITLALEHQTTWLLMDEKKGRSIAASYQLPFIGSIGCLVKAKKSGIISAIKPLLDTMQTDARFWIHPLLYATILEEYGE